jgi:hypothetical protein
MDKREYEDDDPPIFTESIINNKRHKKPIPKKHSPIKPIVFDSIPDRKTGFLDKFLPKNWMKAYFYNKPLIYEGKQKK